MKKRTFKPHASGWQILATMLLFMLFPLTATAQVNLNIYSHADWENYANKYGDGKTVTNVTLHCDLQFGASGYPWENFNGTFDGNGHNFIFYEEDGKDSAPFKYAKGEVRNLRMAGRIYTDAGMISYRMTVPLACYVKDKLKIFNCVSDVTFYEHSNVEINNSYIGGFISTIEKGGDVTFEQCAFTGCFNGDIIWVDDNETHKHYWWRRMTEIGGFVSRVKSGGKVSFKNCLYYGDDTRCTQFINVGYYVGCNKGEATYDKATCYAWTATAHPTHTEEFWYEKQIRQDSALVTQVTKEAMNGGEITYRLNNGRTGSDAVWVQTLGEDLWPRLRTFFPNSKEIALAPKQEISLDAKWNDIFTPFDVTLPEATTKYIVTSRDDEQRTLTLSEFTSDNIANVPLIIENNSNEPLGSVTLPGGYYNLQPQTGILRGNYEQRTAASGEYTLGVKSYKAPEDSKIPSMHTYITGATGNEYALVKGEANYYLITSKDSWNTFKTYYNGKEMNVYLACDLTLTKDDEAMESFKGTFDGQGHSIIYDFVTSEDTGKDKKIYGLFYKASGTIKNLNITGTIRVAAHITYALSYPAPLAFETHGNNDELNIENCHSDVSYYTGGNSTYTGAGFIISPISTTINFKDCSFTGTFASPHHKYAGGFVGQHWSSATINLTNCFSDVHIPSTSVIDTEQYTGDYSPETVGYFIGKQKGGALTLTNCYAHNSSTLTFGTTLTGQTIVTDSLLAIGEITYKLQADRTGDDNPWGQTIGTDTLPQLQTFATESKEVFHADESTQDYGTSTWATFYYPAEVTIPNGVITYQMAGTDEGQIIADDILSESNKDMPLLLRAGGGIGSITLPEVYYNRYEKTGILRPVYEQTEAADDWYVLQTTDEGDVQFAAPETATSLDAWTCYSSVPVEGIAISNIEIKSKTDWDIFKTRYSGANVNALLSCDLKLTEDDEPMESLVGTFNGQAHTITVDYTSPNYRTTKTARAPFRTASGTIKNLRVDGNIINDAGNSGTMYAAPFVYKMEEDNTTLNVENCVSAVNFFVRQKSLTFGGSNPTSFFGGFIEDVGKESSTGIVVNFKDCSYLGSITGKSYTDPDKGTTTNYDKVNSCGGFVGKLRKATASLQNCYSDTKVTLNEASSSAAIYDFVLNHSHEGTVNISNCYSRKAYFAEGKEFSHNEDVNVMTDAQVKSGEVAYRLRAGGDAWRQTIGTDTIPQLATFYEQSKLVYEAAGGNYKLGTTGWGTLYYPTDVTLADGVKAYTVGNVEEKTTGEETENYVVLTAVEGSTLPAYTAAILCSLAEGESTATEKTIPLKTLYYNDAKEQTEGEGMTAMLYGMLERTEARDGWFIMQNHGGTVAFYQVDTQVAQPSIPAFRCALLWVPEEDEQASAKVNLRFDDEPTGINNILEPLLRDGAVYDLQGRKVQTLQKNQIYIKNGKKFIVR